MTESHLILAISRKWWRADFLLAAASLQPAMCKSEVFRTGSVHIALRKTGNGEMGWLVYLNCVPPLLPLSQLRLSAPASTGGLNIRP